jgi:hypothetical protein
MQTSIEWLFEKLNVLDKHSDIPVSVSGTPQEWNNLFEQAKEMHKQDIIDAKDGLYEHIGDVNKMIEISDKQLENILHTSGNYNTPYHKDSIMSYGKICEHNNGYLCEHRRQYIISLFKNKKNKI